MENLINQIKLNTKLEIKAEKYVVKTKTWYTIEEDNSVSYLKCELSNEKVLVMIPSDNFMYLGKIVDNMNYSRLNDDEIEYNGIIYNKTGAGHQYIKNIDFGDIDKVEGKCIYEDYEFDNNIISLGILPDKNNIRADVFAEIISFDDIKMIEK